MNHLKLWGTVLLTAAACTLASCSSDSPLYEDPDAYEKTVKLQEQYIPLVVGTWHYEQVGDKQRVFEQLTFKGDSTFTGFRKWQSRSLVTIDGQQRYTDWEDAELCGSFTGTWQLRYWSPEGDDGKKRNCISLAATYDGEPRVFMAYSDVMDFDTADATTLRIQNYYFRDADGWTNYQRGEAEPSFARVSSEF